MDIVIRDHKAFLAQLPAELPTLPHTAYRGTTPVRIASAEEPDLPEQRAEEEALEAEQEEEKKKRSRRS